MGASHARLSDEQREAIYRLKRAGKSGTQIQEICARGEAVAGPAAPALPPFSISPQHANTVAKRVADERGELYADNVAGLPFGAALQDIVVRLLQTADRETQRLERLQRQGRLDAAQLGKLAGAAERLQRLLQRSATPDPSGGEPAKKDGSLDRDSPAPTFAEELLADGETAQPDPAAQAPTRKAESSAPAVADVVLGSNGGSYAPRSEAVPGGHLDQDTTTPTGEDGAGDGQAASLTTAEVSGNGTVRPNSATLSKQP